jgi:hypothetical protein
LPPQLGAHRFVVDDAAAPEAPIDVDHRERQHVLQHGGEVVARRTGSRVMRAPTVRKERLRRGEEEEKVERFAAEDIRESPRPVQLRRERGTQSRLTQRRQGRLGEVHGAVKDALNGTEALVRGLQRNRDAAAVGDVSLQIECTRHDV